MVEHVSLVPVEGVEVTLTRLIECAGDRPGQQGTQQQRADRTMSDDNDVAIAGSLVDEHGIDRGADAALLIGCRRPPAHALVGLREERVYQMLEPFGRNESGS